MTTTAYERLIAALEQHGCLVQSRGQHKASAQCPAHEDRAPSLSVTGIEGQVLLHCHAGCAAADVLASLNLTMADLFDTRRGADYRYDNGRVVHRKLDKSFPQTNTDRPPELYRLEKVRAAVAEARPVFVVEGEKDVHALESIGVTATCAPMGAGKWSKVDPAPLYGGKVLVIADQDEPGRAHADEVAKSLRGRADVGIFAPKSGKDAADHIAAGFGVSDFLPHEGDVAGSAVVGGSVGSSEKKSAATVLVELAQDSYQFGVSTDGEVFSVPLMSEPVVRLLRGGRAGLRPELANAYFRQHGKAAPQQALADALLVIEGHAGQAEPVTLWQRVAKSDGGSWWLDLGDQTGQAIRVDGDGWRVGIPPMRFRRTTLTGALPHPETGGDLAELWDLLNVAEIDRPLVVAWLVAALIADIPHPILTVTGEQGTGKSTAARTLVSLIDPSPVALRKPPRDSDSWVTAAAGSWVVALDNLSDVSDWLSDSLCRAATGDGDVRRQLYTDGGLAVFAFKRAILLNGIDLGAVRGDLADRLLVVDLEVIDERSRQLDADLAQRWAQAQPRILGALLAVAAGVAGVLPSVRLERSPRMADFARVLAAVDQVLGTDGLHRYVDRGRYLAADALSADPFVGALAATLTEPFEGTAAQLLARVSPADDKRQPRDWPKNARALTTLLKRQAPVMRRAGWQVDDEFDGHTKVTVWRVTRPEIASIYPPPTTQNPPLAGIAGLAGNECDPTQEDMPTPRRRDFYADAPGMPTNICVGCGDLARGIEAGELCIECTAADAAEARRAAS